MKKASPRTTRAEVVETLSMSELTMFCDTNADWVIKLVEHGVVAPVTQSTGPGTDRSSSSMRWRRSDGWSGQMRPSGVRRIRMLDIV